MVGGSLPGRLTRALVGRNGWPAALVLAGACWLLAITAISGKSNTFDEIAHLTAGYGYWTAGTYHLNPENGNLPQRFAALPLLGSGCRFVPADDPALARGQVWDVGRRFFFELGNPIDPLLLRSRALMATTGAALVLLVFVWSRSLWGVPGALVSATLTACCPTLLANAPLVTSDAMSAVFFLLTVGLIWRMLHIVSLVSVVSAAVAVGCLFLTKMSAGLIVPVVVVLGVVRLGWGPCLRVVRGGSERWVERPSRMAAVVAGVLLAVTMTAWLMIWAAFGMKTGSAHPEATWRAIAAEPVATSRLAAWAQQNGLLPEPYLYGFAYAMVQSGQRSAFLNGRYSTEGWPLFFPFTFLVKTPLPAFVVLALALTAAASWFRRRPPDRTWRHAYELAPLLCFVVVYGGVAVTAHLNIGHRHLLPLYPALYILAGAAALAPGARIRAARWILPCSLALSGAASLVAWPNYLAYFNVVAGGPRHGYRRLVDSSLDWGQDLRGLKRWLADSGLERPGAPRVYLSYFGTASMRFHGIGATLLPGFFEQAESAVPPPLTAGLYCISATMLQGLYLDEAEGPVWTQSSERRYLELREQAATLLAHGAGSSPLADERARGAVLRAFRHVQLAKLCASLRRREPDHQVGHSILVYRLTQAEVDEALRAERPHQPQL
jgi:hypothetical protein